MTDLQNPIFYDLDKAREALEAARWPNGPYCPHCGNADPEKIAKVEGIKKSHRPGLYYCNECKGQFTVTVGTVFERSKVPLTKWWLATHLMASSKKGISAHQLHRMLGVTYKTAWFMAHRIREAMKDMNPEPMGGEGKIIEADETYFGKLETPRPRSKYATPPTKGGKSGGAKKRAVLGLVERGNKVRTFHIHRANAEQVREIIVKNVSRKSDLHTDESKIYTELGKEFTTHKTINHRSGEYVRGNVHTNSIESHWSVFKRGMKGIYQHCGETHLHRYLAEFEFRHNNRTALKVSDRERTEKIMEGIEGKRLTYRRLDQSQDA
ncbi:MAG: IS1595 family transposase [Aestuariivirga sp.]